MIPLSKAYSRLLKNSSLIQDANELKQAFVMNKKGQVLITIIVIVEYFLHHWIDLVLQLKIIYIYMTI